MLQTYTLDFNSCDLSKQVKAYFSHYNKQETYIHTLEVIEELKKIRKLYDFDYDKAYKACLLHDIGRVVEKEDLVQVCKDNQHVFLAGEKQVPNILHQIASRIIAERVFHISDPEILSAIECHTTLKANPSLIEEVVFLSDKLSWKEKEHQEQINSLRSKLQISMNDSIGHYLENMHNRRHEMKCYHDWTRDAYKHYKKL